MSVLFHQPVRRLVLQALAIIILLFTSAFAHAAQVTLAWNPNNPAPEGYRVFQRLDGGGYDYTSPVWPQTGDNQQLTTCTIGDLADNTNYYFVVRAYVGNDQSGDSNEVTFRSDVQPPSTYTLSSAAGPNGNISPGTVTVNAGAAQTFTITPHLHYHVVDVIVDGNSVGPVSSYTFSQVNADHSISASFAVDTFTISASAGSHGSISPSGTATVSYGASRTYSISAAAGYHVADVLVDGNSVGPVSSYTFSNVTAAHTISASFADSTHTITASAGAHGTITPGTVAVSAGSTQIFAISPDAGYHVADVLVDGNSVGPVTAYTFSNVTAAHTISASFAAKTFTISSLSGEGGTISPYGQVVVAVGASQSFSVTADEGYEIETLMVDGASMGVQSTYTFNDVETNHSITATFIPTNQAPVADAGPDQVVDEAQVVTLSGVNSRDADDGISVFQWRQIQGISVTLSAPNDEETHFTAPDVDGAGQALVFELTVTDSKGATAKDTCIVNVTWINQVPTASAGEDQIVTEGDVVTLNAAASTDADDGIAEYSWLQVQGPQVSLSEPRSASPSFTAPDVGSQGASLVFELTVTDTGGLQDTDNCKVSVTWNNNEPVADAGPDRQVEAGAEVTLDGSQSMDPDGSSLLYEWRQTDGPPVILSDATAVRPVFTAPSEGFEDIMLRFELTVTDNGGLQGVASCQVSVKAATPLPDPNPDIDSDPPVLIIEKPESENVMVSGRRFYISGKAFDNRQVDRVVWVNDRGQSGVASGTEHWQIEGLSLHRKRNSFTITAYDTAGNAQSKTITVYRTFW